MSYLVVKNISKSYTVTSTAIKPRIALKGGSGVSYIPLTTHTLKSNLVITDNGTKYIPLQTTNTTITKTTTSISSYESSCYIGNLFEDEYFGSTISKTLVNKWNRKTKGSSTRHYQSFELQDNDNNVSFSLSKSYVATYSTTTRYSSSKIQTYGGGRVTTIFSSGSFSFLHYGTTKSFPSTTITKATKSSFRFNSGFLLNTIETYNNFLYYTTSSIVVDKSTRGDSGTKTIKPMAVYINSGDIRIGSSNSSFSSSSESISDAYTTIYSTDITKTTISKVEKIESTTTTITTTTQK